MENWKDVDALKKITAQNLIRLRTSHHLTQFELGEKISYSDKAVSRWERGEAVPDAYVLLQLSEIFHVTVDDLLHEHTEEEVKKNRKKHTEGYLINYKTITGISLIGVWTLALFSFVLLFLFGHVEWMVFVYTLPVSFIVLLVLNSIWGDRKKNLFIISALIWSILAAVYLSFIEQNWWILFLLGIPAQVITCLCFHIRIRVPIHKK